jgi:hypothetical protein
MTWQIPEFEPASRYSIQITGNDVYLKVRELDDSLVGTNDYLGFAYWWCGGDDYKHTLREAGSFERKRIHDVLIHNNIPLIQEDRDYDQQSVAIQIYRQYL